ncbi:ORF6N domain-containing protein [Mucilaginibacter gilvus]|uniref:ORF6N domain-containing protein n=1 Tax=Mucilaginibacter gilvus TaxID=2305909 RepID=A0A3S3YQM7_9SPHI|nr:ORF6N domain-containing protein [Mucilaginibacter gilvus]RWY48172.1 ORF6N domain-containing protein [Mucilaginibacter gilvus]
MEKSPIIPDEVMMNQIYYVRGQKVMLDKELAELYKVTTGILNQAVSRNIKRFPPDFMFQLTDQEWSNLKSQIVISNWGGRRSLPYVFTEQGVAMLSGILNSDLAIAVNIQIMRIFIRIRQMFIDNTELRLEVEKIKGKLDNQDKNMEIVFRYLDELIEEKNNPTPRKRIGFKTDDL